MIDEQYFKNRSEAGKKLAVSLSPFKDENVLVLALPRGGVPIGYEVAEVLHAPLSVLVARKIGAPGDPEFGIGAISEGNVLILNNDLIKRYQIPQSAVDAVIADEIKEMERRIKYYRGTSVIPDLKDKTVILVDDGLATGVTAQAALTFLDNMSAHKVIYAAPVCSFYAVESLKDLTDDIICILRPFDLISIGSYYQNFEQITDDDVVNLLDKANSSIGRKGNG